MEAIVENLGQRVWLRFRNIRDENGTKRKIDITKLYFDAKL